MVFPRRTQAAAGSPWVMTPGPSPGDSETAIDFGSRFPQPATTRTVAATTAPPMSRRLVRVATSGAKAGVTQGLPIPFRPRPNSTAHRRDPDCRGGLLAADPVAVAVELAAVSRVAGSDRCSPCGTDCVAVLVGGPVAPDEAEGSRGRGGLGDVLVDAGRCVCPVRRQCLTGAGGQHPSHRVAFG